MQVAEIWRYPVKTMTGEKLQRVRIGPLGLEGDRVVHVEDAHERVITLRSHPRFLGHKGTLGPEGEPLVDGQPWNSPEVAAEGLSEREWPGGCPRIGKVFIGVRDLRRRCIMTAYDPDTLVKNEKVYRSIFRRFDSKLSLNCFVIEGGGITVGDEVQLVRSRLPSLVASIPQAHSGIGRPIPCHRDGLSWLRQQRHAGPGKVFHILREIGGENHVRSLQAFAEGRRRGAAARPPNRTFFIGPGLPAG